ncbi:MAG: RES family NAD+ phosphorylase [Lysobacterales bacterium]
MIVYRLTLAKYVDSAFSGEGSRRVGGRWTPPGYRAVYASSSIALAVLETLVHADAAVMPKHFVFPVTVPDAISIQVISAAQLPDGWQSTPGPEALQTLGQAWLESADACVLKVPSSLVPQESNFVLNPVHKDFQQLQRGKPESFVINPRLL